MQKAANVRKPAGIKRLLFILLFACIMALPVKQTDASVLGPWGWLLEYLNPCKTPPVEEVKKEYEGICWFCKPFMLMAVAIGTTTISTYEYTRPGAIKLLGIAFGLWLAFTTAMYLFKSNKGGEYIKKIGEQTFRVVVAIALIAMGLKMINLIFTPITDIVLSYGGETLKTSAMINSGITFIDNITGTLIPTDGEKISDQDSPIGSINANLMGIYAYAVVIWRFSFEHGEGCIIPLLEPFLMACMIGAGAIALLLLIPLKIIDALFRIGVVIIMTPLLIAAWAFPITRKYTKAGWNVCLSALLFILFLSITVVIIKEVIDTAMKPLIDGLPSGGKDAMTFLRVKFSILSLDFFILIGAFMFSVKLIGAAGELSKEFGGAEGSGNMASGAVTAAAGITAIGAGGAAYVAVKQRKNIYRGAKWTAKKGYGAGKYTVAKSYDAAKWTAKKLTGI